MIDGADIVFFSVRITEEISKWLPRGSGASQQEQQINEAEGLAALTLIVTCKDRLRGAALSIYIDNTGAQGALVKGFSGSKFLTAIAAEFWDVAIRHDIAIWIGRVASDDNIADPPSRDDCSFLEGHLGARRLHPVFTNPDKYWYLRKPDRK